MALADRVDAWLCALQWGHDWIVVEITAITTDALTTLVLQWGHDWIVVEILVEPRDSRMQMALQWGHDWIVVEISSASCATACETSFNGATTG